MDIGGLIQAMEELYRQAEAQLQHKVSLLRSQSGWEAMQTGLRDTAQMLRLKAGEIEPEWPDAAGDLYVQRMQRSATSVQAWEQALAAAGINPALTALAGAIGTTVEQIRQLKEAFDVLVAQLASLPAGPQVDAAAVAALRAQIIAQLQQLVQAARALLLQLDQAFAETAQRVNSAPAGTPWDGPLAAQPAQAGAAAADSGAAAGGGAPTGAGGGAPTGPAGAAPTPGSGDTGAGGGPAGGNGVPTGGAPTPVGSPAGVPSLAGLAAPPPPATGLPPGSLPTLPSIPPASAPAVPVLPPLVPPVGGSSPRIPGAFLPPGSGRIATGGTGVPVSPVGSPGPVPAAIPRAGKPAGVLTPPGSSPPGSIAPGSAAPGVGTGRAGLPPPLIPPMAGRAGAGGTPGAGSADTRNGGHRARPLRTVPGVPPRLRGRAGKLDATPAFLGPPERRASRRDGDAENSTSLLDEELWQVEQPMPITDPRL